MKNAQRDTNSPRDHPRKTRFYRIEPREDGTVDIYLRSEVIPATTEEGATDYDIRILIVRGVVPWDGMEEDIRRRYDAWCEAAETVYL